MKHKSQRRSGTTHSGDFYEIDLLTLFKIRGERNTDGFYLDTNIDGVGDFDDIVFRYWTKKETRIILLQAKHKENLSNGKVTIEKFKNPLNDKFYLGKYLLSFFKCREMFKKQSDDPIFQGNFDHLDIKFVIYTNCILDEGFDNNRKIDIGQSIFFTDSKKGKNKAFKFSLDSNSDLTEMLENVSSQEKLKQLAKALVDFFCGVLNYNNMMSNHFFSVYHIFLSKHVFEIDEQIKKDGKKLEYREGKINEKFLNGDIKNCLEKKFRDEVLFQYTKNVVFNKKSCSSLDDNNIRDGLLEEVAKSLMSTKKVDEHVITKLIGKILILDTKKRELKFADEEKLKNKNCKRFIADLEKKVGNLAKYTFPLPYKLVKKVDENSIRDGLLEEVAKSLISTKKMDEHIITELGGSILILDTKKRELMFADEEKLKNKNCKRFIADLEKKVGNLAEYTFPLPYKFVKESLTKKSFKLHVSFGNINPNFKKPHLIKQFIKLIQHENQKVINIGEDIVGNGKILSNGDLKIIKKLVGNLLVFEEKEKKFRFASENNLNGLALEFIEDLKKAALQSDIRDIEEYRFDIKVVGFPRDTLLADEEDRISVVEFLSKLQIFTGEDSDAELKEIIKDEIRALFDLTEGEVEENFLKIRNRAEEFWRNGGYYLEKGDDFFEDIVRYSIEFDIRDPSDLFVGREEELHQLHTALTSNLCDDKITVISQMASINGLGGIGKSELAKKYVCEYRKRYDGNVIWINAESAQTLAQSFHDLSLNKLKLSTKNSDETPKNIKDIVEAVYRFFAGRKSLFVFDNAEKSADLEAVLKVHGLLRKDNKPYILITSRENREVWEQWGVKEGLQLDVLKEEDAINFVKKALENVFNIADGSQDENIRELAVNTLSNFPLALRQAVAYIKEENNKQIRRGKGTYSINDYLTEYKKKKRKLLNFKAFEGLHDDYAKTTFTTWIVTFDKIKHDQENGRLALKILDVIAFFAPDNIPVNIFFSLSEEDEEKLWNAIELLNLYSMVKLDHGKVYIHRLVQEVTRLNIGDREQDVLNEALQLFEGEGQVDFFFDKPRLSYVDHAISVWSYASKHEELVRKFSRVPTLIVNELNATLRYQGAYSFGSSALESLKSILDSNDISVLSLMAIIASVLYNLGEDSHSLQIYLKLKQNSYIINQHTTKFIFFEVSIGLILNRQGKYDEALKIFTHLYNLVKRKKIHSGGEIEHNLAVTFINKGKLEDAMDMFTKALELKMKMLGSDDESTLNTMNSISVVLEQQGKYEEALEKTKEVYEKRLSILGSNHPHTLTSYGNIAIILNKLKKYDEALTIAMEVDKERDKLLPNHPRTMKGKFLIVGILANQGKYEESLVECKRVYKKRKQIWGPNLPDILDILDFWYNLALHFALQGMHEKALEEFMEVLKERETSSELNHKEIFKINEIISRLRETSGSGEKFDFNMVDHMFLLRAAQEGQLEVVNELLIKGIDPDGVSTGEGGTPLIFSSQYGHDEIVRKLLEKGANVNAKGNNGSTSLHLAAHRNYLDIANDLLKWKADVDCWDNALFTPLHYTAQEGHLEITKLLLKNGADVNARTIANYNALDIAATFGHLDVVKVLLEEGVEIDPFKWKNKLDTSGIISTKQLFEAVSQKQNISNIRRLLEDGAVINYFPGTNRLTSLHYVVSYGNLDIVKLFLSKKPNVDVTDEDGWTPLHYVVENGDLEIVQLLLDNRADPNIRNREGNTPLQVAQHRYNRNPRIYQNIIDILK